jgi:hypothetical protein
MWISFRRVAKDGEGVWDNSAFYTRRVRQASGGLPEVVESLNEGAAAFQSQKGSL